MRVKRYEAPTLQEALLDVKRELGSDAVILQTRKFNRGGVMGVFGKEMVEVLAATEVNTPGSSSAPVRPSRPTATLEHPPRESAAPPSSPTQISGIKDEIREMKTVLKLLLNRESAPAQPGGASPLGDIYLRLVENDVDAAVAQELVRAVENAVPEEERNSEHITSRALERHLKRTIKISGVIDTSSESHRTVAFVGPTGVGKTTTVAKLASLFTLSRRKRVGVITADTYRIAAVEQIKTYGEILNVPVRVVYNSEDMKRSVDIFSDMDLVLIDTAGRSQRDVERIDQLKELLGASYPLEIHMVLSANMRLKEMIDAAEKFRPLAYNHFVFTKLDEAVTYGSLISVISRMNVGLSYLCFGQNVPEAIEPATAERLINLILGRPFEQVFAHAR